MRSISNEMSRVAELKGAEFRGTDIYGFEHALFFSAVFYDLDDPQRNAYLAELDQAMDTFGYYDACDSEVKARVEDALYNVAIISPALALQVATFFRNGPFSKNYDFRKKADVFIAKILDCHPEFSEIKKTPDVTSSRRQDEFFPLYFPV